jgi:hypothetical protein
MISLFTIIPLAAHFIDVDAKLGRSVCYLFTLALLVYCHHCGGEHQTKLLSVSFRLLRGTIRDHYRN